MSTTLSVFDPEVGRTVELNVRRKKGRTIVQELPSHLHVENASGRRLQQLADFGHAAMSAYDAEGFINGVPVVAAVAGEATRRDEPKRELLRAQRREHLLSLIPPEILLGLEQVGDAGAKLSVREPLSPFFAPVARPTIRRVAAEIPPLP